MSAVKAVRFVSPANAPLVGDIEDLLSARRQEPAPLTLQEEESDPADCVRLSQIPPSQPVGMTSSTPRLPVSTTGNKRLWLFSPEPPSYSQILSSSHDLGVDQIQV